MCELEPPPDTVTGRSSIGSVGLQHVDPQQPVCIYVCVPARCACEGVCVRARACVSMHAGRQGRAGGLASGRRQGPAGPLQSRPPGTQGVFAGSGGCLTGCAAPRARLGE